MTPQQGRSPVFHAAAAVAGSLLLFQLPALPPVWCAFLLPVLLLAAWRVPWLRVSAFLALGFCWSWWHAAVLLDDRLAPGLAGEDLVVEGRIVSIPEREGPVLRFVFAPSDTARYPDRIRLSWYYPEQIPRAAETWRLAVRLKRPRGFMNPGGFDYERWLFREGIGATGYVRDTPPARRLPGPRDGILALRAAVVERIHEVLPQHRFAGIVAGLTVGHAGGVPDSQWERLRATGTIHLMAISGFHVTMVAALVLWLVGRLWRCSARCCERVPSRVAGAVAGFLAAFGYALLAGFSVPTQRTLVMLAVALGALLLRRAVDVPAVLAVAALAVLALDPLAVLAPGFWLSFGAVGLILLAMARRPAPRGWRAWLRAQWAVTLGLLPLLLLSFGQAPLAGPLANLLAIPLFSFCIVPACVLALLLPAPLDGWLWMLAARALDGLWPLLGWLAQVFPPWQPPGVPAAGLVVPGLAVLLLLAPRAVPARWLGAVAFVPLLWSAGTAAPPPGSFHFALLDVGQGLAAVVRTAGHTLVYDTGPRFGSGSDTGALVVVPYLRARGLVPDRLVISHSDSDHAGGAESLLAAWPDLDVIAGQPQGHPVWSRCRAGDSWRWDGVDFRFLHPASEHPPASDNARSCVLRIRAGGHSLLLTGDIGAAQERRLLRAGAPLQSDILVVPHHGSAGSSSPGFVAAADPDYALVPAGYRNQWDFPRPVVVARYRRAGARVLETARRGALLFRVSPDGIEFNGGWRQHRDRIWRAR